MNFKILKLVFTLTIGMLVTSPFFVIEVTAQKKVGKTAAKKTKATPQAPQTPLPKVVQIDTIGLQNLLKREGDNSKPLLVNFWATWCGPCKEEFPDLVKIDKDYKGKIDFITITLDDIEEINTGVPKFLQKVKAEMPTYLLKTTDEGEAISLVYKEWQGGLPFTIFYNGKGVVVYNRQGKIVAEVLRKEIDKIVAN